MAIVVNAVHNVIYNKVTFEQTGTFLVMLILFFSEYTVYLDQSRLDVDNPAKFDLFKDISL